MELSMHERYDTSFIHKVGFSQCYMKSLINTLCPKVLGITSTYKFATHKSIRFFNFTFNHRTVLCFQQLRFFDWLYNVLIVFTRLICNRYFNSYPLEALWRCMNVTQRNRVEDKVNRSTYSVDLETSMIAYNCRKRVDPFLSFDQISHLPRGLFCRTCGKLLVLAIASRLIAIENNLLQYVIEM